MTKERDFIQSILAVPPNQRAILVMDEAPSSQIVYNHTFRYKEEPQPPRLQPLKPLTDEQMADILDPVYNVRSTKSREPCIHFKKGFCKLGEKCPYIHEK